MRSVKFIVYLTTMVVVLYTLLSQLNVPYPLVFVAFLISQGLLLFMAYRILTDKYQTKRTFEDWYGDKDAKRQKQTH